MAKKKAPNFPWQVNRAAKIPGDMKKKELKWLVDQAQNLAAGDIWVDIGTVVGRSFMAVALSLPRDATLITVDRHLGEHVRDGHTFDDTYQEVIDVRSDLKIIQIRADVVAAAVYVKRRCNFVFIDADHEKVNFGAQFDAWEDRLKLDVNNNYEGILAGHDYQLQSVQDIVDDRGGVQIAGYNRLWQYPEP